MNIDTTYLGMNLRSPLVASASPLSESVDNIRRMEDAGAGAAVLFSLFEEQIRRERELLYDHTTIGTDSFAEALTYFPEPETYHAGPDQYLELIRKAKAAVKIPIIASLNGSSIGGWTYFARKMQAAGAYALVLFNRFYQPDIDLETLDVKPNVILSSPHEMRLPLTWIGILYKRIAADLAATTGIHSGEDAIKMILAGANVTMMTSALLKNGIGHLSVVERQLKLWMEEHEYESVAQMRGSVSKMHAADPTAFERAQYMRALTTY